jgi:catechol 2,3-dioxygenase-like lactoylglutathione lyase family enzyme
MPIGSFRAALAVSGVLAVTLAPARGQLLPPNDVGLTMGHVLLNVTSVRAHTDFWVSQFDALPIRVGTLQGIKIPGVVVLFRPQAPAGPGEGETINHLGLKLRSLAEFTSRFERAGWRFDPPRIGRETTPQTYVTGPDGFRMELVEDPRLPAAVVGHHLHYWLEAPADVKRWYVQTLLVKPTMRGPYLSGDVPGMNLTFAPLGTQKGPGAATKGRLMDSIGFEVTELKAYCAKVQASGVRFEMPYGRDPELDLFSATLTDPWGVTIRLTQGLAKISGMTPYTYVDGFVVGRPLE